MIASDLLQYIWKSHEITMFPGFFWHNSDNYKHVHRQMIDDGPELSGKFWSLGKTWLDLSTHLIAYELLQELLEIEQEVAEGGGLMEVLWVWIQQLQQVQFLGISINEGSLKWMYIWRIPSHRLIGRVGSPVPEFQAPDVTRTPRRVLLSCWGSNRRKFGKVWIGMKQWIRAHWTAHWMVEHSEQW